MNIRTRNKGFTLVEMAVVVVILGLMAALILPGIFKTIERNRLERGRAGIEALKNEAIGYVASFSADADKKLPPDTATDFQNFRYYLDPWKKNVVYYYDENLLNDSDPSRQSVCEALGTNLSIQKNSDPQINNIAFILVSSGKNMNQETSYAVGPPGPPQLVTYYDYGHPLGQYEYDDLVAYVSLAELKGKVCTGGGGGGATTISGFSGFAPAGSDEGAIYNERNSLIWGQVGGSGLSLSSDKGTLHLGVDSSGSNSRRFTNGCFWYQDDEEMENCSIESGRYGCTLGDGLRAYFTATFSNTGDGFTFSIISAATNTTSSCGGWDELFPLGATIGRPTGELLAYAGPGISSEGILAPKIGLEFDIYQNTGSSICQPNSRQDPDSEHIAFLFWGRETAGGWLTPWWSCIGLDAISTWDDNRHGEGGESSNPQNPLIVHALQGSLRGDTIFFRYEIEVDDASAEYTLKSWVATNDPGGDFKNVTSDYSTVPADYSLTQALSSADHDSLKRIIFGFTQATGREIQDIVISNFELAFK